jgi:hypothetical protein
MHYTPPDVLDMCGYVKVMDDCALDGAEICESAAKLVLSSFRCHPHVKKMMVKMLRLMWKWILMIRLMICRKALQSKMRMNPVRFDL